MNHLTEPGVKHYFLEVFKENKQTRLVHNTYIFNGCLLILFILGVSMILYFKKKNKLSPVAKNKKFEEDRAYILNKIKSLSISKQPNYMFA